MSRDLRKCILKVETLEERIVLDDQSAGVPGIEARALQLTGAGVHIGMVEPFRVGKPGHDSVENTHPHVNPQGVYLFNLNGPKNVLVDTQKHATPVAGVMIASDPTNQVLTDRGIATRAKLHSAGFMLTPRLPTPSGDVALTLQHVARQNQSKVSAINLSFGIKEGGNHPPADGTSLLSKAIDYFARKYDTLFVIAKPNSAVNEGNIPADAFNGLVVGNVGMKGNVFSKIRPINFDESDDFRRLIHVVAPGVQIKSTPFGGGAYKPVTGTSFAAPHATATVALLHEYANNAANNLPAVGKRHDVMKAILINSAEKLTGRLGMKRTIERTDGKTWLESDARDDKTNDPKGRVEPLDIEMGTGFLNASRALTQLKGGRSQPGDAEKKAIAWDSNDITGNQNAQTYKLPKLRKGSWISATLTWDRVVQLNDTNNNGLFDWDLETNTGEDFTAAQTPILVLELLRVGENQPVWTSETSVENVQHIFFQLRADQPNVEDEYELRVRQLTPNITTKYAIAWWGEKAPPNDPNKKNVGNFAWDDQNENGLQDLGESGIQGVTVELYDASTNELIDTTETDYDGQYLFENVDPGDYYVQFQAPYGYGFTLMDEGSDDAVDSDADEYGQTADFTITSVDDLTRDAGLKKLPYGSMAISFGTTWTATAFKTPANRASPTSKSRFTNGTEPKASFSARPKPTVTAIISSTTSNPASIT